MTTQQKIRLQGIGWCNAKPASEVCVGDRLVWNYGYVSVVLAVETKGKFVHLTTQTENAKEIHTRRKGVNTLLAYTTRASVLGMVEQEELSEGP